MIYKEENPEKEKEKPFSTVYFFGGAKKSITEKVWYMQQTERILKGIDKREEEVKANNKLWSEIKRQYQQNVKMPYIASLKLNDEEEESEKESEEELNIKEFGYTDINLYFSLSVENRINRELRQIETDSRIAEKNFLTNLFWSFNSLYPNENKDIIKKYRKEERERKERLRLIKENRKIRDKTTKKDYDYTKSSQAQHEDKNFGANHNTPKRQRKQLEVKALQYQALQKVHKILRVLKKRGVKRNFLKSVVLYCGDIISDSEPSEVILILNELQRDTYQTLKEEEEDKTELENLKRYMDYSNRLENLREFGISYKLLVNKDKRELKTLIKQQKEEEV